MIKAALPISLAQPVAENSISQIKTVGVVIVNWNGAEHLEECLTALCGQTLSDEIEVIVIDNDSTDRSIELMGQFGDFVRVIRNPVNVGFAAGCNQGIQESRAQFIALLNNDAVPEPKWLEAMLNAIHRAPI